MAYLIEKGGGESAYRQLYRQLREQILAGVWPQDSKLPSKRRLAAETGLSLITVEHALTLLLDEGLCEARERSGLYVSFAQRARTPQRAALSEMQAPRSLPEDFPFAAWARITRRVLSERGEAVLEKSPPMGSMELRQALSEVLARSRGVAAPPERVLVGSGAEYLYGVAAQLLGSERPFAHESPCYEKIPRVYRLHGVETLPLRMGEDGVEGEALERCHAGLLHVTPYRSYPSGVTATAERRRDYLCWARRENAWLLEDDYDAALSYEAGRMKSLLELDPERVLYLSTFSKTLSPGMRLGYLVLPEGLCERYHERLGFYACTVPLFDQLILAEFIRGGEYERLLNRRRRAKKE